jgi:luciferase-like monooxygenase
MADGRRFRGMGRGRKVRRVLERGGTGPAHRLNETLGAWPGVRITPMFGRWGYFVGAELFACFPLRDKERDLWIHLSHDDQARALREGRARPHRRFARTGWVELSVETGDDVTAALRWLRRAYAVLGRTAPRDEGDA